MESIENCYGSKKTKDLVKVTTMLEKCFMKNDTDDPRMWILELKRLNREVGQCDKWDHEEPGTDPSNNFGTSAKMMIRGHDHITQWQDRA